MEWMKGHSNSLEGYLVIGTLMGHLICYSVSQGKAELLRFLKLIWNLYPLLASALSATSNKLSSQVVPMTVVSLFGAVTPESVSTECRFLIEK
jgi:hypothetical protein